MSRHAHLGIRWPVLLLGSWLCFASSAFAQQVRIQARETVPSPAWKIQIVEVWEVGGELWVLSQLSRNQLFAPAVISSTQDSVKVTTNSQARIRRFAYGKDWNWHGENPIPNTHLKTAQDFQARIRKANGRNKLLFQGKPAAPKAAQQQPGKKLYIISFDRKLFDKNGKTERGETVEQLGRRLVGRCNGKVENVFGFIKACTATLDGAGAKRLKGFLEVKAVEADRPVGIQGGLGVK